MKQNKFVMICLILALAGILLGGIGFLLGGRVYGFSLGGKGVRVTSNQGADIDIKYIEEKKDLTAFQNLEVDLAFSEFKIIESDHFGIEYRVREDSPLQIEQQGDSLVINQEKPNGSITIFSAGASVYDNIGKEYVIISIPKDLQLGTLKIQNESGDVKLCDLKTKQLLIDNSFSKIEASKLSSQIVEMKLDSCDIHVDELCTDQCTIKDTFGEASFGKLVAADAKIELESGDISLDELQAEQITLKDTFGHIEGTTLTVDYLNVKLESSDCTIDNLSAKKVDLDDSFGEVQLGLREGIDCYTADIETTFGTITVNREDMGSRFKNNASKEAGQLYFHCESTDIKLSDIK